MQASPPDPAAVTAAVQALAALERLDLTPRLTPPEGAAAVEPPAAVLQRAGPAALAEIEAAIPGATGTGRVALAQVVLTIDRERGDLLLARLVDDPTPAIVNTCLVGFRSVAQWAHTIRPPPEPGAAPPPADPMRGGLPLLWLVVAAGALALAWLTFYK